VKHGDRHIITDSTTDKVDLVLEPSIGGDLLIVHIDALDGGRMSTVGTAMLDRDAARRLFSLVGAFLHSWEA